MIYLDNNASTVLYPEAIDVMIETLRHNANAGAPHKAGRMARKRLEDARKSVGALVGATPEQVIFTSGATEANNMAIMGGGETLCLVSAMEHPSIMKVHPNTEVIPVNKEGIVDLEWLDNRLQGEAPGTVIVSVLFASHETGVVQPVKEIAKIVAKNLQRYHLDAVQGAGKCEIDFAKLGVQSISYTAHKIGGAQGVGALVYDPALNLNKLIRGGGQERAQRPGTPNIPGVVSFEVAANKCLATIDTKAAKLNALRERLEREVMARHQQVIVASAGAVRLPGTSRLILPGVTSQEQVIFMDLNGICVSAGAACSPGVVKPSQPLLAMGYSKEEAESSIRVGMGWSTTEEDVDGFIEMYSKMITKLVK